MPQVLRGQHIHSDLGNPQDSVRAAAHGVWSDATSGVQDFLVLNVFGLVLR